jgi:tetratricopeptide (TPR) repeat protein
LLEKSYLIFKEHSGHKNVETAKSLGNLAVTLGFLGNYLKAKECHKQALSTYHKSYGKDHLEIGWLSVHFGNTNRDLGQFDDARSLYEASYQIFLKK